MNKKGEEEGKPVGSLIAAVVAVVVLVLVVIAIWLFASGKIPFFQYLPSFNQTKPMIIGSEIFRYSLSDGRLQVYDGTSWQDLKAGTIEVNNKKMIYADLMAGITRGYIGQKVSIDGTDLEVMPYIATNQFSWWQKTREFWGARVTPGTKELISGGTVKISGVLPNRPLEVKNDPGRTYVAVYYLFNRDSEKWQYRSNNQLGLEKEGWTDVENMALKSGEYTDEQTRLARALIGKTELEGYRVLEVLTFYLSLTGEVRKMNSDYDSLISPDPSEINALDQDPNLLIKIKDWRDSLISQTVKIDYINPSSEQQTLETCYFSSKYKDASARALVVDLSRPLPSGGTCPYLD